MNAFRFSIFLLLLSLSLSAQRNNVLAKIIRDNAAQFSDWAQNPDAYELQVLYTQIDRDAEGRPSFTTHRFGADPNRYFYPASTVKMPAALLALEKLHELDITGLNAHSPMHTYAGSTPQTAALSDTSSLSGAASVGHYVRKVFLVSDNDAYNRTYEFLGQAYLNKKLQEKGFTNSRIIHRLSVSGYDTLANRTTNPVSFFNEKGLLYHQQESYSQFYDDLGLTEQVRGLAYINSEDEKVEDPFDFRYKNYLSVQDLHDMLRAIIFPMSVNAAERFQLSATDYKWVYRAMAQFPRESEWPRYDKPDNYVKFWLYGEEDADDFEIPDHIRIFNKVGWAYGFLTDAAYIVDLEAGIEFFLVGTIHVNANQTYNDGVYEYEEQGLPFFGELGRAVYQHELNRRRKHVPELGWIKDLLEE